MYKAVKKHQMMLTLKWWLVS